MLKVLKWIGIVLGGLIGLIVIAMIGLYFVGSAKVNSAEVPAEVFSTADGDATRGKNAANAWLCTGCHGSNLGGTEFMDDIPFGYVPAPNLTSGEGGLAALSDEELEHAIRHGVGHDNRQLIIMPSRFFNHMADSEVADLIAYMRSAEPVDNDLGARRLHPLGAILFGTGVPALDAALSYQTIDHDAAHLETVPTDDLGLGEYRAIVCKDCHGENLNGGPHPFEPDAGIVPNLTPDGDLGEWTEEDFIRAIREGKTPDGSELAADDMPWPQFALLSDDDLHALWVYLQSLEPLPTGGSEAQ